MTDHIDFNTYAGNLRVTTISFDVLAQKWQGLTEEYDPADAEANKFYIGKIGEYMPDSYLLDKHFRTASITIKFANGYELLVEADDVVATDEGTSWSEHLPKINTKVDTSGYKPLTDAEKDFADKVVLQLLATRHELLNSDMQILLDQSIALAIYRTDMYTRRWDQDVEIKDEE
jgi:hypothetical protein